MEMIHKKCTSAANMNKPKRNQNRTRDQTTNTSTNTSMNTINSPKTSLNPIAKTPRDMIEPLATKPKPLLVREPHSKIRTTRYNRQLAYC